MSTGQFVNLYSTFVCRNQQSTKSLYAMVLNICVAAITVVAVGSIEQTLTCTSQRCNCTDPNSSAVACYFTDGNF